MVDQEMASIVAKELVDDLISFTTNIGLQVMQGTKVIEVRNHGLTKGDAGFYLISKDCYDLILASGDDRTDEDLFKMLPESAYSIKVSMAQSQARFNLHGPEEMLWVHMGFAVGYLKWHVIYTMPYIQDICSMCSICWISLEKSNFGLIG